MQSTAKRNMYIHRNEECSDIEIRASCFDTEFQIATCARYIMHRHTFSYAKTRPSEYLNRVRQEMPARWTSSGLSCPT